MLRPVWLAATGIALAFKGQQTAEFDPFAFSNLCHHYFGRAITTPAAARLVRAAWIKSVSVPVANCSALPSSFMELPAVGGDGDASVNLDVGYDADTQRLCYVSSTLPVAPVIYVSAGHTLSITINDTLDDSGSGDVTNCPIDSFEGEGNYCTPAPIFQESPGDDGDYYKIDANQAMAADGTTNLHVHGLMVSPKGCGDDTVKSVIYPANWGGATDDLAACQTGPSTFTYTYQLPEDQPAGLYWYHDHRHGFTEQETQMGLAGAIIVEDGGDLYRQSIGVSDEVLVVTDLPIRACLNGVSCDVAPLQPRHYTHPAVAQRPADSGELSAPTTLDRKVDQVDQVGCAQGAAGTNGAEGGEELWNLRLNGANVAETMTGFPPDNEVLQKTMQPNQRQIFRLVNAAADSFLSPQLVMVQNGVQTIEPLEVWARDGVGIADANGTRMFDNVDTTQSPLVVPPAGRVEFVVHAPPVGATLYFDTQQVSPGCGGNQYPARRLLLITAAGTPVAAGAANNSDLLKQTPTLKHYYAALGATATVHRTVVFSEYPRGFTYGATNWLTGPPTTADYNENLVDFYITQTASDDGTFKPGHVTMTPFDPNGQPDIVVHLNGQQSVTEEWLIQNSTLEAHDFHIHQIHFRDVTTDDTDDNLQPILDSIVVPPAQLVGSIASGIPGTFGYVKLRMTFTKQDIGEFMFHCHIMEHEDSGMMKYVKVVAD